MTQDGFYLSTAAGPLRPRRMQGLRRLSFALASVSCLALSACGNVGGVSAGKQAYGAGDYAKAREFFENVSYDADAKFYLGRIYRRGEGVEVDYGKAAQYFEAASVEDHIRAKVELAALYESGRGVERSAVRAIELYEEAILGGRESAKVDLAMLYVRGADGVDADPERGAQLLREAWVRLEPSRARGEAAYELGKLTLAGKGVEADTQAAIGLFEASLDDGYEKAGIRLGDLYRKGKAVEADPIAAARFYRAAADLTDGYNGAKARYLLGMMFLEGDGIPRDAAEGSDLLQQAAQRGYVRAAVDLGRFHEEGELLPRDLVLAEEWYRDAIAMDDGRRGAQAQYYLARLLLDRADEIPAPAEAAPPPEEDATDESEAAAAPPEEATPSDDAAATEGVAATEEVVSTEDAATASAETPEAPADAAEPAIVSETAAEEAEEVSAEATSSEEAVTTDEEAQAEAAEDDIVDPDVVPPEGPQLQEGSGIIAEAVLLSPDQVPATTPTEEAIELLEDAAERGYSAASLFLARLYANGTRVKRDYSRAADWFQKTANDDDGRNGARARYYLAQLYLTASGVAQNTERAVILLKEATASGYARAAELLGELYDDGSFIDRDPVLAFAYLTSAVRGGRSRAETSRQRLEGELSEDQRAKAEELSLSFHDGG